MNIISLLQEKVAAGVLALYGEAPAINQIAINKTRKEFEGDFTVVTFPFTRVAGKKPEDVGAELGQYLQKEFQYVAGFNVVKGFLNLVISDTFWLDFLVKDAQAPNYGQQPSNGRKVLVEYSSPNTNKPLHLGHIRNILLGWSTSRILETAGYQVKRVQIVNDRGIAICKSMLGWQRFAGGATPETKGIKGDHFVGQYYVAFERAFQEEYRDWQQTAHGQSVFNDRQDKSQDEAAFFKAYKDAYFNVYSPLGADARDMLRRWEAGDPDTISLWHRLNQWVYDGFDETYRRLGVYFDKIYYESDTYLLGKDLIQQGLDNGVFYRRDDGSVWIDLTDAKLDHKVVLRSDGTSVYITQDIGTARLRYDDFGVEKMVYVVGDEQNYHFQVLFEIMKRLGEPYAQGLHHLSYGMVDLPTGRMKSREGTVVDADDLVDEVIGEAREGSKERDATAELSTEERENIIRQIGLAALKYFIIKVHPQKRMIFDPKESVDLQGQTGPYIQNAYVRIQSVLRKAQEEGYALTGSDVKDYALHTDEKDLIALLYDYPAQIEEAAANYDPSVIAAYCYGLAKSFHKFYHDFSILRADTEASKQLRIMLSSAIANSLKNGMDMLGIEMPERM
ncbi:MAG: arginine--tRNA ligase [Saprospiraceae bacterium]|nr:arginine--tRNA ligase [Saprospiraceae bacterium]